MPETKKVMIVDDEPAIREMVAFALERSGFQVQEAADARGAMHRLADEPPSLILLDWMLPDLSGVDLARRLKKDEVTSAIPIIMLTARSEENDKIRGLEVGADDYVTKPFSPRELVARIHAVLRRAEPAAAQEPIEQCGLQLDPSSHRVTAEDKPLELGPTEFRLLHFFMTHPERVYSRGQLLDRVWGQNVYIEERTVDVHIRRLRKALSVKQFDRMIQTVRGAGYRFSTQV
jgi:two-component system phosphate regulon response regulator PhoB